MTILIPQAKDQNQPTRRKVIVASWAAPTHKLMHTEVVTASLLLDSRALLQHSTDIPLNTVPVIINCQTRQTPTTKVSVTLDVRYHHCSPITIVPVTLSVRHIDDPITTVPVTLTVRHIDNPITTVPVTLTVRHIDNPIETHRQSDHNAVCNINCETH